MTVAVCWKWVSSGDDADARWAGVSPADHAALELALELRPTHGAVTVVCVGPPGADAALREALAAGAAVAVRIEAGATSHTDHELGSREVADALASVVADADFVVCGDYSMDRGTGSVPAFLAHELGVAQALGLVEVDLRSDDATTLQALRRLDGGRREVLEIHPPAVLSLEGSVRRLRRATLAATVSSKSADVEVIAFARPPSTHGTEPNAPAIITSYRPRARTLPAPTGSVLTRVREILDVGGHDSVSGETVELSPAEAAVRIIEQLRRWGYLDGTGDLEMGEP
jgi:electron transfer flavoprotein beta subunit